MHIFNAHMSLVSLKNKINNNVLNRKKSVINIWVVGEHVIHMHK